MSRLINAVADFRSRRAPERPRLPLAVFSGGRLWGSLTFTVGALAAFVWANSPWSASYVALRDAAVGAFAGGVSVSLSARAFVNEGLMTVFIFSQALWARRLAGAGINAGAVAPAGAAAGALIVSAAALAAAAGADGLKVAIAAGTVDIGLAFAAHATGDGLPASTRHPLFAFAGFGEASWIVAVCLAGADGLNLIALAGSGAVVALAVAARPFSGTAAWGLVFGGALWLVWRKTGLPPAACGVLLAMAVPPRCPADERGVAEAAETALDDYDRAMDDAENDRRSAVARRLEEIAAAAEPPIDRWQRRALRWSTWVVLPLFGWANFGMEPAFALGSAAAAAALIVLRPAGAFAGGWIMARLGPVDPVERGAWRPHALLASLSCAGGPVWALGAVTLFPDGAARASLLFAFFAVSAAGALAGTLALKYGELDAGATI